MVIRGVFGSLFSILFSSLFTTLKPQINLITNGFHFFFKWSLQMLRAFCKLNPKPSKIIINLSLVENSYILLKALFNVLNMSLKKK